MTNRERIEAYFDNQLSTTEEESLLRDIESDSSLKTEFEFQQDIVEGIQAYRKEQLIARLNNVKVASTGTSTLTKVIGTMGVAAIITGGLFWYFDSDKAVQMPVEEIEVVEKSSPVKGNDLETIPAEQNGENIVAEKAGSPTANDNNADSNKPVSKSAESTTPDVQVPDMVEPDSEGISAVDDDSRAPESLSTQSVAVSSSGDVEIKLDKKYNFHYQVLNGDLTLYGEFNDSKFEVIELKTNLGIKLYLYYNNRYFELKNDSEKIRPLVPVESKEIITELDKRRQ